MTHPGDLARGRDTVARWCNLAEKRLDHLTELFETGRWRRFHTEQAFLENIREAKQAVETWRDLMARDAAPDHFDLNMTVARKQPAQVPQEDVLVQVAALASEPEPIVIEPPRQVPHDVLVALEIQLLDVDEAPEDAPDFDDATLPPLDLDSIGKRYPLLHNAL